MSSVDIGYPFRFDSCRILHRITDNHNTDFVLFLQEKIANIVVLELFLRKYIGFYSCLTKDAKLCFERFPIQDTTTYYNSNMFGISTVWPVGHIPPSPMISIMITVLTATCQLAFQLVLLLMPPYGYFLDENPLLEKILRHAGFVRLDDISLVAGFTWLTPEIVMLIAPIVFFSLLKKLNGPNLITISESQSLLDTRLRPWKEYLPYLIGVGRYGVLAMLCLAAIARPSIPGGLYYLVFLCSATWWACYKQLRRGFAIVLCCLIPIVFLHICCLYAYQFQWPQEILAKGSPYARYFGLTPLIIIKKGNSTIPANTTIETRNQSTIDMSGIHESFDNDTQEDLRDYREFVFSQDAEWASFANPFLLYSLYVIIILASRELLKPELIRTGIGSKKNSEKKSGAVIQDSTGSVTVTGEVDDTTLMNTTENTRRIGLKM
ncbi:hypothetical protein JTB14_029745 [Gonioctena quinquepunctata]|nr:hypothetical protein JTB14_029745 [Gonioctena quinquepunctata]